VPGGENDAGAWVTVVGVVDGTVAPADALALVEGTVADGDVAVPGCAPAVAFEVALAPRVAAGLSTPGCGTVTSVHPLPEAAAGLQIGTWCPANHTRTARNVASPLTAKESSTCARPDGEPVVVTRPIVTPRRSPPEVNVRASMIRWSLRPTFRAVNDTCAIVGVTSVENAILGVGAGGGVAELVIRPARSTTRSAATASAAALPVVHQWSSRRR
jgi:hypothetical protein